MPRVKLQFQLNTGTPHVRRIMAHTDVNNSRYTPRYVPDSHVRLIIFAMVLATCLYASNLSAGTIYVYELDNGSRLITDTEHPEAGYQLVKKYSTEPYSKRKRGASYTSRVIISKYDDLILEIAEAHKIDAALLKAVVHVESAFDPYAVSRVGAMGLMQLMPGTAAMYNLTSNQFDAQRNLYVGAEHLRDLLDEFDGNIRFALAGYNAGVNAVNKYNGIPPYDETTRYVEKVMKLYSQYLKMDLNWSFSKDGSVKLVR